MPLGEYMITVLQNNKKILKAKQRIKNVFYAKTSKNVSLYNLPEATPELLVKIRLQIKVQQQKECIKMLSIFVTILSFLVVILV